MAVAQLGSEDFTVVTCGVGVCWSFVGALALLTGINVDVIWREICALITNDWDLCEELLATENARRAAMSFGLPVLANVIEFRVAFVRGEVAFCERLIERVAIRLRYQIKIIHATLVGARVLLDAMRAHSFIYRDSKQSRWATDTMREWLS